MSINKLKYRYIAVDFLASLIVWILIIIYRKTIYYGYLSTDIRLYFPNFDYSTTLVTFPLICLFFHFLSGYYVESIKKSKLIEFTTTFVASIIISFVMFFLLLLNDVAVDYSYYYRSLLVLFALLFSITYLFRVLQSAHIRSYFKKGKWRINTLIIGEGKNAQNLADEIKKNSDFNRVVGFIRVAGKRQKKVEDSDVVGSLHSIDKVIESLDVSEVIVALDDASEQQIFEIINRLFQYNIDIRFTPRLYEILTGKARINRYGLNPLVNVTQSTMTDWELSVKRTFDIITSVLSLIILSPLMIYFSILIKLGSKGPVFFRQERVGYHGKTFKMIKFRTMYQNSEKGVPKLSSPDDERITKVGRTLRKYRLDEIPQFFNVIKGDMSIVGPRPERKFYIDQIIQQAPYYCLLYRIRPGLTSWGPIKVGYANTLDKMVERLNYDIVYMENMNLFTDLKIILHTLEILFKGKGV
ncbi:MAG TPA: sugar transferase [Bacteroidales bacterium]|nr:sugar transferase [Bacteroidales bacterium]